MGESEGHFSRLHHMADGEKKMRVPMAFLSWLYCLLVDFYIQTTVMYNARDYQNIRVNDIESNVRRDIYI